MEVVARLEGGVFGTAIIVVDAPDFRKEPMRAISVSSTL